MDTRRAQGDRGRISFLWYGGVLRAGAEAFRMRGACPCIGPAFARCGCMRPRTSRRRRFLRHANRICRRFGSAGVFGFRNRPGCSLGILGRHIFGGEEPASESILAGNLSIVTGPHRSASGNVAAGGSRARGCRRHHLDPASHDDPPRRIPRRSASALLGSVGAAFSISCVFLRNRDRSVGSYRSDRS